jgi:predicted DNA-binding mobile mystery protein A
MARSNKNLWRLLDKKLAGIDINLLKKPSQGWIRTLREALGMTSSQLACRMDVSQPRIIYMEKNEQNLKISTLEKTAAALGCRFVYAFVPVQPIEKTLREKARKKAEEIMHKVNINMALENQQVDVEERINDLADEILSGSLRMLWED